MLFISKKNLKWLIAVLIVVAIGLFLLSLGHTYNWNELKYGVTFSKKEADQLELDWKKVYSDMFTDLGVKNIRLSAYWDDIEGQKGNYNWGDTDWQISTAEEHNAKIILAVGGRLPRWPECHWPGWAKDMDKDNRNQQMLDYINNVISRYKDHKGIEAWQVENEPFLTYFGQCPKTDPDFLDKEISLVRKIDPSRPIVITDSGELSLWYQAAKRADIFGTTMYRDTYSKNLGRYIHYPITPAFFRAKRNLVGLFAKPKNWVVIELQAEPWGPVPFQNLSQADRNKTMDLDKFKAILEFSRQTGFKEFYLWGVEWWYWEKEKNNNPKLWDTAKTLFNNPNLATK